MSMPLRSVPLLWVFAYCTDVGNIRDQPFDFSPLTSKMKGTDAEKYLISALNTNDDYLLVSQFNCASIPLRKSI
jgi:hypothetical protein